MLLQQKQSYSVGNSPNYWPLLDQQGYRDVGAENDRPLWRPSGYAFSNSGGTPVIGGAPVLSVRGPARPPIWAA